MKKITLVYRLMVLLIFTQAISVSIASAQNINYTINYNDPYDITKVKGVLLLGLENIVTPSIGAMGRYELGKIATFDAQYRRSFVYIIPIEEDKQISTNTRGATNIFEATATYHISDKLIDRKLMVNLKTEHYGTYTHAESITVPIKSRKIFGARCGVFMYHAPVSATSTAISTVTFRSKNDTTSYKDNAMVMATSTGVFFGLSTRRIDKAGIAADGYGNRRRNRQREVYADVFLGGTSMQDLQLKNGTVVPITANTSAIGWRVGGQWMDNGTYVKMEIGKRPFVGSGFMINFIFGFILYGNEKGMKKK